MNSSIHCKIQMRQLSFLLSFFCVYRTLCYEHDAVEKGSSITFSCPSKAGAHQRWRQNGKTISSQLSSSKSTNEWFNLTLDAATMEDRGTFECQRENGQKWSTQTSYNLTVLEAPVCGADSFPLSLEDGDAFRVSCASEIPGVTLIWHVGVDGERSVGARKRNDSNRYITSVEFIASRSMNEKFVYCELQHPAWHVLDGIIDCKIGPLDVRTSLSHINCHLTSDSPSGSSAAVSCSISSSNSRQQLSAETVVWQGHFGGEGFENLDLRQDLRRLAEGEWSTKIVLDQKLRRSLNAIRLQAGDVVGEAIQLGPYRSTTSYGTVVIVMVVLICIAVVVFFVVVILYRQGRIFKPPLNSEIEMDKRALTPLEKSKEENRLLTHGVDAGEIDAAEEGLDEGIDSAVDV